MINLDDSAVVHVGLIVILYFVPLLGLVLEPDTEKFERILVAIWSLVYIRSKYKNMLPRIPINHTYHWYLLYKLHLGNGYINRFFRHQLSFFRNCLSKTIARSMTRLCQKIARAIHPKAIPCMKTQFRSKDIPIKEKIAPPRKAMLHPNVVDIVEDKNKSVFQYSFGTYLLAYCLVKGSPRMIDPHDMSIRHT